MISNYFIKHIKNRNFIVLISIDILFILSAFYISLLLRYDSIIPDDIKSIINPWRVLIFIILKVIIFKIFHLYKGMWRYTSIWDIINILKANIVSSIFIFLIIYNFIEINGISNSVFILDFILCTLLISITRTFVRLFYLNYNFFVKSKHKERKKVLIIGAGFVSKQIISQILDHPQNTLEVIGILDDNKNKIGSRLLGYKILGNIDYITSINIKYDEIFICCPSATNFQMKRIIKLCTLTNKKFKTLPSINEIISEDFKISQLREVSLNDLLGRKEIELDKNSIKSLIKNKVVLITGAGGSIGSELARQCSKFNPRMLILADISEFNLFQINREMADYQLNISIKPILIDIRENDFLDNLFKKYRPEIVFHAAAYKHVPMQESFPSEAIKTNIFGTLNLSKLSDKYNVKSFVLVSTDKAVRPTNVMGATKRIAEIITQHYNLLSKTKFISVRFGNVLGSSGSVIPIFQEQIKKGGPLTITDLDMERYFMSIPEASQLILQAGSLGKGSEIFILDMGKPIKIIDIAHQLIKLSGYVPITDIDIQITGKRPGEKKTEELAIDKNKLDNTKHEKILVLEYSKSDENEKRLIYNKVVELQKTLIQNYNSNDLKIILSKILADYKPSNILENKVSNKHSEIQ